MGFPLFRRAARPEPEASAAYLRTKRAASAETSLPPSPSRAASSKHASAHSDTGSFAPSACASSIMVRKSLRVESTSNVTGETSLPFRAAASAGPRVFNTLGPPDVSASMSITRGVESQRLADVKRLAERLPVHVQREIDGELHARPAADRADVLDAPAKLIEDGARSRDIRCFTTDEPEEFAVARRSGRAAHRTVDERCAFRSYGARESLRHFGPHGAHFDEKLALGVPRQQPVIPAIRRFDRVRIRDDAEYNVRALRKVARRRCHF
jgi:hypothetical protein